MVRMQCGIWSVRSVSIGMSGLTTDLESLRVSRKFMSTVCGISGRGGFGVNS